MSAASQARRRRVRNDLEILVLNDPCVSTACGEPYYVGGCVTDIGQLEARTSAEFARGRLPAYAPRGHGARPQAGEGDGVDLAAGTTPRSATTR